MTSTVLDRALSREAQLIEELKEVRRFIALYHRFDSHEDAEPRDIEAQPTLIESRDAQVRTVKPREAIHIVLDMLRHHKKPLRTRAIFGLLEERSIRVSGKNPMNNLSAALHYDKRLKSTSSGWVLAEGFGTPEVSGVPTESKALRPLRDTEAVRDKENQPLA